MGAVTWDIMKGMTFRSEFGFENNSEEQRRFWGMETSKARSNNNQPVAGMEHETRYQVAAYQRVELQLYAKRST